MLSIINPDVLSILMFNLQVSMSLARRALPKTLRFMEERLKAQTFTHLNKIGLNSMPNQFPMLFGLFLFISVSQVDLL